MGTGGIVNFKTVSMYMMHLGKSRYSGGGTMMSMCLTQRQGLGLSLKLKVEFRHSHEPRIHVQFWEIKGISLADAFCKLG